MPCPAVRYPAARKYCGSDCHARCVPALVKGQPPLSSTYVVSGRRPVRRHAARRRLAERVREHRRSRSEPVQVWRMHFGLAQELSNGTQVIDSNHQHVVPLFCVSLRQRCSAAAQNQGQSSHLKRPAPPKRWAHFNDAFIMRSKVPPTGTGNTGTNSRSSNPNRR